jgi:CheY-specific phosphatase CheX
MLARKIRDTGCKDTVVIQVNENDSDALAPCFDAALTRTYMPTVFADAFRRCCETRFSMVVDTPVFTLLRTCARSAAQQAMGMLAQTDVSVSVLPAEHHADADLDVVTRVTLTMWKGTMAVDMELRCTQGTATQTAASLLGVGADDITAEDAQSSLGELANIVAGRIQSVVAKEYGPAKFTIPTTGTGSNETGFRAQFGLRAAAKNSDAFVDLLMSARPLRPGAGEVRAA